MSNSNNSPVIATGRIETLTNEEELRLKELWAYILNFWGRAAKIPVSSEGKKLLIASSNLSNEYEGSISSGVNNLSINHQSTSNSITSGNGNKEKKGRFSKLKIGKKKKDTENDEKHVSHKRVNSLTESIKRIPSKFEIENKYTDEMVHEALKDLKPDEMYEHFWNFLKFDSPDNLVLRFLRARKWDTDKALAMISNTLHWRIKDSHIDQVMRDGELKLYEEYIKSDKKKNAGLFKNFELGKSYIKGHDKNGRPIVFVRPRLHHSSDQTTEEMELYTLMVIESARIFLREPIDSASIIFDLTGFSLSNMDYAPVKFMISAFEAHYPESLGVLLIHKAPWVFSGIWNIIKNWLDPVVASKVNFTRSTSDLEKFIDSSNLPKNLGGKDTYEFKYLTPKEDENKLIIEDSPEKEKVVNKRNEIIENFISTTIKWIEASNGSDSAKYLDQRIRLGKDLNKNYGDLDRFVRGRSIFDRNGLLNV